MNPESFERAGQSASQGAIAAERVLRAIREAEKASRDRRTEIDNDTLQSPVPKDTAVRGLVMAGPLTLALWAILGLTLRLLLR